MVKSWIMHVWSLFMAWPRIKPTNANTCVLNSPKIPRINNLEGSITYLTIYWASWLSSRLQHFLQGPKGHLGAGGSLDKLHAEGEAHETVHWVHHSPGQPQSNSSELGWDCMLEEGLRFLELWQGLLSWSLDLLDELWTSQVWPGCANWSLELLSISSNSCWSYKFWASVGVWFGSELG